MTRPTFTAWLDVHRWRVAAAVVVLLAAYGLAANVLPRAAGVAAAYRDWQGQRDRLASAASWEDEQARIRTRQDALRQRFAALYVSLPRSDQMSTTLQVLQRRAVEAGVRLRQIRPGERSAHDRYDVLPLRVELDGRFHGIGAFVDAVERSRHLMKVQHLTLERTSTPAEALRAALLLQVIILKEDAP